MIWINSSTRRRCDRAPLAVARIVQRRIVHRRLMPRIERAMFADRFGLRAGRAAAAFGGGVALDLAEQRAAAVRHAATDHAQWASLAHRSPVGPLRMHRAQADLAEARSSGL